MLDRVRRLLGAFRSTGDVPRRRETSDQRRARRRAEGDREVEALMRQIARDEEQERDKERREASAADVRDAIEREGVWWPPGGGHGWPWGH